jgi:hypothetical protein
MPIGPLTLVQRLVTCLNDLDIAIVVGIGVTPDEFRHRHGASPNLGCAFAKSATDVPADPRC